MHVVPATGEAVSMRITVRGLSRYKHENLSENQLNQKSAKVMAQVVESEVLSSNSSIAKNSTSLLINENY
jgi:hypothetical protein